MNHSTLSQRDLVSFVPLPSWIRAATRCGFAIAPILHEIGIPVVETGPHGVMITQDQSCRLMEACVARAKEEHFPFALGENCVLESIPEIQTYVCSCETLRDAIESYNWVRDLMRNGITISLHETQACAYIRIDIENAKSRTDAAIFFTETLITSVTHLVTQLVGSKDIERLMFRHAAPDHAPDYAKFFDLPVQFDQTADAVVIRSDLLDQKLNGAVPELHRQAREKILHRMSRVSSSGSMVEQLSRLFAEYPDLLMSGLEAAAAKLQIHPRTLQRRLHEENRTFADVQSESRFQTTCALLRDTNFSLNDISEQLGFSDRRALTRAFKRWSNVSPSCYRNDRPLKDRYTREFHEYPSRATSSRAS